MVAYYCKDVGIFVESVIDYLNKLSVFTFFLFT